MSLTDKLKSGWKAVKTVAQVGTVLLSSFLPVQKADAGLMGIKTKPTSSYWIRDGTTSYEVDVVGSRDYDNYGSIDVPNLRGIATWHFVAPTSFTPVSAELPDMVNKKSQDPSDLFYDVDMRTIGGTYNKAVPVVSGESATGNCRDPPQINNTPTINVQGTIAEYKFKIPTNTPLGNYYFNLHSVRFYDTNGNPYGNGTSGGSTSTLQLMNNYVRIVDPSVDPIFIDKPELGVNPDFGDYPKNPAQTLIKTSDIKFKLVGTEAEMFGPSGINKNFRVEILADYNGTPENLADDVLVNGDHTLENIMVNFSVDASERSQFKNSSTGMYELPMVITSTISNNKNLDPNSIVFVGGLEFSLNQSSNVYAKISDVSEELSPANSDMVYLHLSPEPASLGLLATGAAALIAMRRKRNMEKDKFGARRNPYNL